MSDLKLLADAEQLAIDYLLAQTEVTDLIGSNIGTDVPPNATYPRAVVQRAGGTPDSNEHHIDNPRLNVRTYAGKANQVGQRKLAWRIAETLHAALMRLRTEGSQTQGVVSDCRNVIGLQWVPDPQTGRAGFAFVVELTVHPPAGGVQEGS